MGTNQVTLNPSLIARVLFSLTIFLAVASLGLKLLANFTGHPTMFGIVRLFDMGEEKNFPTVFTTLLHFNAALLLGVVAVLKRRESAVYATHWAVLSLGFVYLSVDESAQLHEMLVHPMRLLIGTRNLGIFYYGWTIPASIAVTFFAIYFWKFLLHLPKKTRWFFVFAGMLFVGGAVGFESVEGYIHELRGPDNLAYLLFETAEESMEMAGVITLIWALLVYLNEHYQNVILQFGKVDSLPKTNWDRIMHNPESELDPNSDIDGTNWREVAHSED